MGVSEIYGVNSPAPGDGEPQGEHSNSAEAAEFNPSNHHPSHETAHPPDDGNQQIGPVSSASPPTQSAVEEIERLMAAGAHPVDAATPFLAGTTHAFDDLDSGEPGSQSGDGSTGGRGWLRRLLGEPTDTADHPESEAHDGGPDASGRDGAGEDDDAEATPASKSRRFPVRPVHAAVGATFAVAVLVAALMLGRTPGADPVATTAPMAGSPAPAANPQLDRTQLPIAIEKGDVAAQCESGSTDPYGAFSHEEGAAWKCLAPYDGVGQVLTITLPNGPYVITEARMMPGYDAADKDGSDMWAKNRIVSKVTWRFDDGTRVPQEFDGSRRQQVVPVPEAVANRVTVTIQKTDAPAPAETPISASVPTPPVPGSGNIPKWLDDTKWLPPVPGAESPSNGNRAEEPKAFAISSIEIVGYPVRKNSPR